MLAILRDFKRWTRLFYTCMTNDYEIVQNVKLNDGCHRLYLCVTSVPACITNNKCMNNKNYKWQN